MRLIRKGRLDDLEAAERQVREQIHLIDELGKKHDREIAQLGRQLADRDDTIAGLRETVRQAAEDSKKDATASASRRTAAAEAFHADIRALKDDKRRLERALADHVERLAELTAANRDRDVPVGAVSLVKRGPA